jgi:hypothetical protein
MIKISEDIIRIKADQLEPHPWNFERKPESTDEKADWMNFKLSIWRDGVWPDKPILISKTKNENGNYQILRGRRRWKAVSEGLKLGKIASDKIPCVQLLSDESTLLEAIYGDNDTPFKYRPSDRYRIIKERWGIKAVLAVNSGGDRVKTMDVKESLADVIHKAIPSWSLDTIKKDLANLRKLHREEMDAYPDLSEDKIEKLNHQVLSWWERRKMIIQIEAEKEQAIQTYKKRIEKVSREMSDFNKGFPIAGGVERYILAHIDSKRPEFSALKKIKGLKEYIKKE